MTTRLLPFSLLTGLAWLISFAECRGEEQPYIFTHYFHASPETIGCTADISARQALEDAGISFPKGTDVAYAKEANALLVQNTPAQIERIKQLLSTNSHQQTDDLRALIHVIHIESASPLLDTRRINRRTVSSKQTPAQKRVAVYPADHKAEMYRYLTAPDLDQAKTEQLLPRMVATTLTVDAYKTLLRSSADKKPSGMVEAPHFFLKDGESSISRVGDYALGITGHLAPELGGMELEIYFREPKGIKNRSRPVSQCKASLRDGSMLVMIDEISPGRYLSTFIKGDLVTAEGTLLRDSTPAVMAETDQASSHPTFSLADIETADQADRLALAAIKLLNSKKIAQAKKKLKACLETLPTHPRTESRRTVYQSLLDHSYDAKP